MNTTKIILLIDESGSMYDLKYDTIGGINSFINNQKELPDDAYLTTIFFSTAHKYIHNNIKLSDVAELKSSEYNPNGGTSLYDTISYVVDDEIDKLAMTSLNERPDKYLFVILTDGEDTTSSYYNSDTVKEKIEYMRTKFNWEFIYLGANQDSFTGAGNIGISAGNTCNFAYTNDGLKSAYDTINIVSTKYRSSTAYDKENLINN